jgi:hypothetical protein
MTRVFLLIVQIDEKLETKTIQLLLHQRSLNELSVLDDKQLSTPRLSKKQIEDMEDANKYINILVTKIKFDHKPLLVLGVIPLTKQNLVKFAAAIGAALFTTVLRQSIQM